MSQHPLDRRAFLAAGGAVAGSLALSGSATAATTVLATPRDALEAILAGNRRFASRSPRVTPIKPRQGYGRPPPDRIRSWPSSDARTPGCPRQGATPVAGARYDLETRRVTLVH
jgi:hypothetical protein